MLRGTCKSKCHNFVNTYCMELDPQSTILRRMHKPTRRARTQHNLLVSDPPPSESCVSAAETLLVCPKQVKVIVKLLRCYEIMKGLTTGCLTDYHKGAHPCGKCHMYSVPKCFIQCKQHPLSQRRSDERLGLGLYFFGKKPTFFATCWTARRNQWQPRYPRGGDQVPNRLPKFGARCPITTWENTTFRPHFGGFHNWRVFKMINCRSYKFCWNFFLNKKLRVRYSNPKLTHDS